MIEGVEVMELKKIEDERGFLAEIMRSDWKLFGEKIVQSNVSVSKPGVIRAWHRHERGQVDYVFVLEGEIRLCIFNEKSRELDEIICSSEKPQIVRVPGEFWHGYKVVGKTPATVVYFFNKLYNYGNPDEHRKPFDDSSVIPGKINGETSDKRIGKTWEW